MASTGDIVLIAVDSSDCSENAFHWYFEHQHREGNKILLVHTIEMPSMPTRDTWEKQSQAGKLKGKEIEDKFMALLESKKAQGTFIMEMEKPGEFIVRMSKAHNANWVVMGTRGMGIVRRTVLGSVSSYVMHHVHCPIMVIPPK